MKTILKDGIYDRVGNDIAEIRVRNQGWKYVPKKRAKEQITVPDPLTYATAMVEKEIKESFETKKKPYQKPKKS